MTPPVPLEILLVEDDPTLRMFYGRALRRAGHHVSEQARGDDALRLAQARPFDLFILDWHLPGLNGFDILTTLRASGCCKAIMMLSGSGADAREIALKAGANAFLDKPCGLEEILAVVARFIRPPLPAHAA